MPHRTVRRLLLVAIVGVGLALPGAVWAEGRNHRASSGRATSSMSSTLWSRFLMTLVEQGCRLAPWGLSAGGTPFFPAPKAGCGIDPSGRCLSTLETPPASEAGSWIDPSGRCLQPSSSKSAGDAGCGIDPGGRCN